MISWFKTGFKAHSKNDNYKDNNKYIYIVHTNGQ